MVPQWDLLNLLAEAGAAEPAFTLKMSSEVTGVVHDGGRVAGVRYRDADGERELRADLTVGCDGRASLVRQQAGLPIREFPVSFDVWWFRLPRPAHDEIYTLFPRLAPGKAMIVIPREDYLQIALLIPKGSDAELRARGLDAFRADVLALLPEIGDAVNNITDLDDVKMLDVKMNRLRRWHADGLVCIGDAAHAMSPAGGVGINVAIQDAVATARLLAEPLRRGSVSDRELSGVRRRRVVPTAVTQALQVQLDRRLLGPIVRGGTGGIPSAAVWAAEHAPWLTVIPAYLVGVGVRPERAPAFARRAPR
jgi:2-polyprenyl-6-methoxyphenol hydroxylase-like FAD-dependent oxidoreductase